MKMKMKTKLLYTTIALFATLFTSCELERLPYGSMADDQITEDPLESFDALLNGAYAQMKSWSDPMHRCGEYAGDNMMIRGSSTDAFFEFISYSRTPDNYRLGQFWDASYKAIAQTSNVIGMIEEGQSDEIDSKLGECYYIRGLMYFYLCRAYGRPYYDNPQTNLGVPIVNGTPDNIAGEYSLPDRSTVKETYIQVISDLRKAEELINVNRGPAYASKEAAQALLSKVYLFMTGTYDSPNSNYADSVIFFANKVIESGEYSLLSRDQFMISPTLAPENNSESIFVVKRVASEFSGYDHYYGIGGMYGNIGGMGWGEMFASGEYLDLLNETGRNDWRADSKKMVDARAAFIEPQYISPAVEVFRFIKDVYSSSGEHTNYNYVQLPVVAKDGGYEATEITGTDTVQYTLVAVDAEQDIYEIVNYKDGSNPIKTYQGVIDNQMKLNRVYPEFYITKCSRENGDPSHLHSPIISRLSEVYLNRAEAYYKKGNMAGALADVNMIRERSIPGAGYATITSELIDKERQLELAYQAERSYDVYRNGGELTRMFPGPHNAMEVVKPNDYRVIYFIPQDAIDAYPTGSTLTQNPVN